MNGESTTAIYSLPCVRRIAGGKLSAPQGAQLGVHDDPER